MKMIYDQNTINKLDNMTDCLEQAFLKISVDNSSSNELPSVLPLSHITIARNFQNIVDNLQLQPSQCQVFNTNLLYFYYNNLFYVPGRKPTKNAVETPIALLFNTKVIESIETYYPYDTGAAHNNIYGSHSKELRNFEKYHLRTTNSIFNDDNGNGIYCLPRKLVHYIYGSNDNYICGRINPPYQEYPEPFPTLFNFLKDDLTKYNCDERQYIIECQVSKNISLQNTLEWIAYPESLNDTIIKLHTKMQPNPPMRYIYESHSVKNPTKIVGMLQNEAQKYIKSKYLEPQVS